MKRFTPFFEITREYGVSLTTFKGFAEANGLPLGIYSPYPDLNFVYNKAVMAKEDVEKEKRRIRSRTAPTIIVRKVKGAWLEVMAIKALRRLFAHGLGTTGISLYVAENVAVSSRHGLVGELDAAYPVRKLPINTVFILEIKGGKIGKGVVKMFHKSSFARAKVTCGTIRVYTSARTYCSSTASPT
ncbi:TPA: hypothetical protein EYP44_04915 [Candidatus Bathyarchaeota archaeon]|nr:hypothetical protein [Candidatus Bathyarchaeota archaeon]